MNNESILQIVITAVNDAAEQIESVVQSLAGIGEAAATTSASASESLSELGTEASAAATTAIESWDASLSDLENMMAEADAAVGEGFSSMAADAAKSSDDIKSSISSVGGKLQALGIQGEIIGAAFLAPVVDAVAQAADKSSTLAQGLNQINNIISGASGPTAENATQIANLTAKIDGYKATIAEAGAASTKWNGTIAEVSASHQKAAASIETARLNIQKYQNELDPLLNQHSLVGQSAQDISNQFTALATTNTDLGVSFEDSYSALVGFLNQTKSTKDATAEYGAALDLVASGKIPDMKTATQDVTQAFNGMGRSLQQIVPDMRDGVSGMDAINQITAALAGSPAVALEQFNTQIAALGTKSQDLAAAMATGLLPALTEFVLLVNRIVDGLTKWFTEHQKVGEVILIFFGIVGATLAILSPFLVILGLLTIATEALNTVFLIFGITMEATIGLVTVYIGAFLLIAVAVALIIVYHKQIMDAIGAAWTWIVNFVRDHWQQILNFLLPGLASLVSFFLDHWTQMKADAEDFWNGLVTLITNVVNSIEKIVAGLVSNVTSAFKALSAPINAITGAVGNVAGGIGSAIGGTIKAFASGGIVNSPTLALVGEAGPEAIIPLSAFSGGTSLGATGGGGGSGNIVVNINGGSYLDSNGATMIANALARQIQLQLKLRNYF